MTVLTRMLRPTIIGEVIMSVTEMFEQSSGSEIGTCPRVSVALRHRNGHCATHVDIASLPGSLFSALETRESVLRPSLWLKRKQLSEYHPSLSERRLDVARRTAWQSMDVPSGWAHPRLHQIANQGEDDARNSRRSNKH